MRCPLGGNGDVKISLIPRNRSKVFLVDAKRSHISSLKVMNFWPLITVFEDAQNAAAGDQTGIYIKRTI
jgi:hypothetical protein